MTQAATEGLPQADWPAGLWPLRPGVLLLTGEEGSGKTHWLRQLAAHAPQPVAALGTGLVDEPAPELSAWALLQAQAQRHTRWDADLCAELVDAWQLGPHLQKSLYMLSTGTRRKLGLVAAFASRADWVLLDQPYAALDLPSQRVLTACLQALARDGHQACVLADHLAPEGLPLVGQVTLAPRHPSAWPGCLPDGFTGRGR